LAENQTKEEKMRDDKTKSATGISDYLAVYSSLYFMIPAVPEIPDFKRLKINLGKTLIETVDSYYERFKVKKGVEWAKSFKAGMNRFPDRVKRLNELALLANECTTLKKLDKIRAEVEKLIYGDKEGK
jgi:hypothetical protein